MNEHYREHLERVRAGVANTYNLANLSTWITRHTKLEGKSFSFKGHEYQKDIIDDPAKTLYCVKSAQTGMTEIFARWALGAAVTQENFTIITTFPASADAQKFAAARLQPVIDSSPAIRHSLSKHVDSVELKKFGENSFIYTRGTFSETGALSVPADLLIHDEVDKSDQDNLATYVSRLQHKPTKMRRLFSTPTVEKFGISACAANSKRKRQLWTCSHCNHTWLPSFEEDIHIPGWDRPKKEITKQNIKDVRWAEAKMLCPSCLKVPDSDVSYRQWVVENLHDNYDDVTYYVTPFTAPSFLTPPYLVKAVADFSKWSEYCNQVLGLTAEDQDESLTRTDVENSLVQADLTDSGVHYMGVDMGLLCRITVGRQVVNGPFLVVHREFVSYTKLEARKDELIRQYRIVGSVYDAFPYTDIITRITDYDPNARGAVYVNKKSTELYVLKDQDEDVEEGKLNIRAIHINREIAFDHLMTMFKERRIFVQKSEKDEEWLNQMLDMKRVQQFDKHGGLVYKWVKTTGNDHYHHSLLYCVMASMLSGAVQVTSEKAGGLVFGITPKKKAAPQRAWG